jgi:hypothetical protein
MRGKAGLFARVPPPFNPSSVGGMTAWWDASDSATLFDATAGGSVVAADGSVARWEDKSGSGRHWKSSSSTQRPTRKTSILNSRDVVRFDGSDDRMSPASGWVLSDVIAVDASTVFVVAKADSDGNFALLETQSGSSGFFVMSASGTVHSDGNDADYNYAISSVAYTAGNWKVLTTSHNGSQLSARLNGGSASNSALGFRDGTGNEIYLGTGYFFLNFFDGDVAEIIFYNVALSAGDREAVESYLMDKWAIT